MRRGLTWALTGTVVASVAALWSREVPRVVSAIEPRLQDAAATQDLAFSSAGASPVPMAPLPAELPRPQIEPAKRDIFVPYTPPAPPAPPPPPPPPSVAVVTPPPPPQQAPVVNLRFLGSMLTPAGERRVYLARGDVAVPISVGDRLDEGYVVTALAPDAVTLTYPSLQTRVIVPITQPAQP